MSFATWMDLEIVIPSEVSQTEKEKYRYDIPHMWNPKGNHSNELIYKTNRPMDLENKLNGCQRRDSCRWNL